MSKSDGDGSVTRTLRTIPSSDCIPVIRKGDRGKWFFLWTFIFACFLFWWLPSLLFRAVAHIGDAVEDGTIAISVLALGLFIVGYLIPAFDNPVSWSSEPMLDACGNFAYKATIVLFIPALFIAIQVWSSRIGVDYGMGDNIPRPYQAVLYTHLFFGFMHVGSAEPGKHGWRRILIATALVILPRLIVSLHGGRFFLAQAVVPAVLIAIARGWLRVSFKRIAELLALTLVIIFMPSLTRGDFSGQSDIVTFFAAGGSLRLYQDNMDLNLNGYCPPLVVSITAKTIPYGVLGVCVIDFADLKDMPATLSRILTINDPNSFNGTVSGTGSNYLLDLYLFGGMVAVYAGSALFGFTCRVFMGWIGKRSLFAGIWAECLTRSLFAPRSDLGYVYEQIPLLIFAALLIILVVWAERFVRREYAAGSAAGFALQ